MYSAIGIYPLLCCAVFVAETTDIVRTAAIEKLVVYQTGDMPVELLAEHVHQWVRSRKMNREKNDSKTRTELPKIIVNGNQNVLVVSGSSELLAELYIVISLFDAEFSQQSESGSGRGWCTPISRGGLRRIDLSELISKRCAAPQVDTIDPEEERIVNALSDTVKVGFKHGSIQELAASISNKYDINVYLDVQALPVAVREGQPKVKLNSSAACLRSALMECLAPLGIGVDVRDEHLVVSSIEKLRKSEFTVVYPVGDLIASVENGRAVVDFGKLAKNIQSAVLPESWKRRGSLASVRKMESKLSLVIRQRRLGQRKVRQYLAELRAERKKMRLLMTSNSE